MGELGPEVAGRLVGESVLRCAILHAHAQVETGQSYGLPLNDCRAVFETTVKHLSRGGTTSPLDDGSLAPLVDEQGSGLIWTEEYAASTFGRAFRSLVTLNFGGLPCAPTADEIAKLRQGAQLARELLPSLAPSALAHAHATACVSSDGAWKGKASSSQFNIGGTIFLSRSLDSPWWVAEHLFHEALHQKLYDIRHGHLLLELDFAKEGSPTVWSPWNQRRLNGANQWDAQRVLAAFHVYVHLSLFGLVVEQRAAGLEGVYGPVRGITSMNKAMERAHYLGEQLVEVCWGQLGLAGRRLVEWLTSILNELYVERPPKGAYVHLCLDLYQKEAKQTAGALAQPKDSSATLEVGLQSIAEAEVAETRGLLNMLDAQAIRASFESSIANFEPDQLGSHFPEVRKLIASSIHGLCPNGYSAPVPATNELIKKVLETASEALYALHQGYSPALAHAKRSAHDARFPTSCDDQVGRLLMTLAAAVRQSGRILEIGTGVGVGTAWICEGLRGRDDVELLSVERDPALADRARLWTWPPNVTILSADATALLPELGTFDLVFADAAPLKYGHANAVINSVGCGGFLVIDDLEIDDSTTSAQRDEKQELRTCLRRDQELNVLELAWATGVILASRSFGDRHLQKPGVS